MQKRRVLITGGMGFVGSHLATQCLEEGWQVSVIHPQSQDLAPYRGLYGQVDAYPTTGSTDEILGIVHSARPDLVFHLASVFVAEHEARDIRGLVEANVLFGTQVLEAMTRHHVPYLVNTGTSWQHFLGQPYNPVNLYAATKQAFEDILAFFVQSGSLTAITLKLFDTYGAGDPRRKLFTLLREAAGSQQPLAMSPGEQLINLVHVDDVARAFLVAADRLFSGLVAGHAVYTVSSGNPIRLRELVALYERVGGVPIPVAWGNRPYRQREVMQPWSTGETLPGWDARIGLAEGIRSVLEEPT